MHVHFVLAHPEPQSFNGSLVREGISVAEAIGWTVTMSDLYQMNFDPCERSNYFPVRAMPERFDVQTEQRRASDSNTLAPDILEELERLDRADLLILQYPMWWHMPPAILKGWFDRVWAFGAAYTSKMRFENGRFAGKRAMLSVTVGLSRECYMYDGRGGDIDLLLWPMNFSLAYGGYTVIAPFVAYGVEGGLRYSDAEVVEMRLAQAMSDFRKILPQFGERDVISFNRQSEWGPDGRIVSGAPVHSPFIRRKPVLDFE